MGVCDQLSLYYWRIDGQIDQGPTGDQTNNSVAACNYNDNQAYHLDILINIISH